MTALAAAARNALTNGCTDLPGLIAAMAHELDRQADLIDRLVSDLARATGRSEALVRLGVGLGGPDGASEAHSGLYGAESAPGASTDSGRNVRREAS